ncbi:segregation/condensation protein A [bacterium]|nr:segregation/condensation protein A [bacterium]
MLNPKNAENFYINSTAEFNEQNLGFNPDSILDKPADELDGLEVLYQMAKQGKIDPWNIDIADIADKYMLHISESKSNNLRLSGRALFFLAVLLKLKSNVLVGIDPMQFEIQEEPVNPEYDDSDDSRFSDDLYYQDYYPSNVIPIEDIIQRRTSVKQNRNRIVTLKDLIRQLEFYEKLDKQQSVQNSLERAKRRVSNYKKMSNEDIINLAQEEYIESSVKLLHENLTKIFEKEEKVELNTLTLLGLDKITAYIALLFLSVKSEFEIEQEEFYSDLYVVKAKPEQIEESITA